MDKEGKDLVDGGGEIVYGSNGDVYAPGGQGVLSGEVEGDVLYYHYREFSPLSFIRIVFVDLGEAVGANMGVAVNISVGYEFKVCVFVYLWGGIDVG